MQYAGQSVDGVYHSIYDSFTWMENFGDPEFIYHEGLAQMLGILAMRFATDTVIPLNYTNYASKLQGYLKDIQDQVGNANMSAKFDFSSLASAITLFTNASVTIDAQSDCVRSSNDSSACINDLNGLKQRLQFVERRLLINALTNASDGLPSRPWFKHVLQAPALYNGYVAQVLPGIAQGILENSSELIQAQIIRTAASILDATSALTELTLEATTTPNKCYGDREGIINITVKGGFLPLLYLVNNVSQSNLLYNQSSGSHAVVVKDARNITSSINVTILPDSKLEVRVVVYSDGLAEATASGGFGNYSFVWSTNETTKSIKIDSGSYNVIVTDANGCSVRYSFSHNPEKTYLKRGTTVVMIISAIVIVGGLVFILFRFIRRKKSTKYSNLQMQEFEDLKPRNKQRVED